MPRLTAKLVLASPFGFDISSAQILLSLRVRQQIFYAPPEVDLSKKYTNLQKRTLNSDMVIRTQNDITESLVKGCGRLILVEGRLYRVRICSGFRGKEAACPVGNTAHVN